MIVILRFLGTSYNKVALAWIFGSPRHAKLLSNISFCSCIYWYATLIWYALLWNAQVNKASSINKGIVKTCLIVDMVRKNWSWIAVAGSGLHYFVLARFGLLWVVANFSTAERFKYLFFTAMAKIHTMACIVKKPFYFFTSYINLPGMFLLHCRYGIIVQASLFNLY